jgi:hypothetical protein
MNRLKAGGISIHDGRTWHGSKEKHQTDQPRRGMRLHFRSSSCEMDGRCHEE